MWVSAPAVKKDASGTGIDGDRLAGIAMVSLATPTVLARTDVLLSVSPADAVGPADDGDDADDDDDIRHHSGSRSVRMRDDTIIREADGQGRYTSAQSSEAVACMTMP